MTVSRVPNVEGGIQPTIVTAKGDLITAVANANPARLGVGSNGQLLTADSSTATGLSYQNNFSAGKNKIINGDFNVWQRGTSFNTANAYTADRWIAAGTDATLGTYTVTRETFTPGTAPVAGYEGQYFWRYNRTVAGSGGSYYSMISQRIEDVRTFAGQTVTISFWAKGTATGTLTVGAFQAFGSGGSSGNNKTFGTLTVTGSWTRYTFTATLDGMSGKTIGTSSYISTYIDKSVTATGQVDIWGWQMETGSTATAFQTSTGTIQGELAACQRYYYRIASNGKSYISINSGGYIASSTVYASRIQFPITMRTQPSSVDFANLSAIDANGTFLAISNATIDPNTVTFYGTLLECAITGGTSGRFATLLVNNNTSAFLGFSAEL